MGRSTIVTMKALLVVVGCTFLPASPALAQFVQQGPKLMGTPRGPSSSYGFQGYSVSLSADGNTAIIGAPLDDFGHGAAFVWTRSGGAWRQQAKLIGLGGGLGFSVS